MESSSRSLRFTMMAVNASLARKRARPNVAGTNIVCKITERTVRGQHINIQIHQHYGERLHLTWDATSYQKHVERIYKPKSFNHNCRKKQNLHWTKVPFFHMTWKDYVPISQYHQFEASVLACVQTQETNVTFCHTARELTFVVKWNTLQSTLVQPLTPSNLFTFAINPLNPQPVTYLQHSEILSRCLSSSVRRADNLAIFMCRLS
jgi:hypothetical protein